MCRIAYWQLFILFLVNMESAICLPKRAQNLLSPEPELSDENKLESEYFKPKEYTSRDFPRLVDGLGQQIRRDLDEAHSAMALHAREVQNVHERIERLEQHLQTTENVNSPNQFLVIVCLLLLLVLALLLAANCFMFLFNRIRTMPNTLTGHQLLHCAPQ